MARASTFDDTQAFNRLEVRNPTATDIILVIFVGWGSYIDHRLNVVAGRAGSFLAVYDSKTKSFARGIATIAAATRLSYTGVGNAAVGQFQRKSLQVTNYDASVPLYICDSANGNVIGVRAGTTAIIYDSGALSVYNPAGAAVSCDISETWYVLSGF